MLAILLLGGCTRPGAPQRHGAVSATVSTAEGGPGAVAPATPAAPRAAVREIVAQGSGTCAIREDGTRVCWGGVFGAIPRPPARDALDHAPKEAAFHRTPTDCQVLDDRTVSCAGRFTAEKAPVRGVSDVEQLIGREDGRGCQLHCALSRGGEVSCWGLNDHGQLGRGAVTPEVRSTHKPTGACEQPIEPPRKVLGVSNAVSLVAGQSFACALLLSGEVSCWGDLQGFGQHATPAIVPGLAGVEQIIAGPFHVCALTRSRQVLCFGNNWSGEIGNGFRIVDGPHEVPGIGDATSIHVGDGFSCALARSGKASCWGTLESRGRVRPAAEEMALGDAVIQLSGTEAPCLLTAKGAIHCMRGGQLARVPGQALSRISVHGRAACGVAGGRVVCSDLSEGASPRWREPSGLGVTDAVDVAVGAGHTCVLRADHTVEWFGRDPTDPSRARVSDRARVDGLDDVRAISAGGRHCCATKQDGSVWCWGNVHFDDAYRGDTLQSPERNPGLFAAKIVSSTSAPGAACALTTGGAVECWGWDGGRPLDAPTISGAKDLAMDVHHACAVLANGHVTCWGDARWGATGTGDAAVKGVAAAPTLVDLSGDR